MSVDLLPWTIPSAAEEAAVLVELGLVEQRYRAVLEVLDGAASITDVARRYGRSVPVRSDFGARWGLGAATSPPSSFWRAALWG